MPHRKPKPTRKKSKRGALAAPAVPQAPAVPHMNPTQVVAARHLFWENVIREILPSLSTLCAMRPPDSPDKAATKVPDEVKADAAAGGEPDYDPSLFDGRLAVITKAGERVAIAQVLPLFACGINTVQDRGLSLALECTVFQISTPDGHVYTLPLHEIRAFHALTPEVMKNLERAARGRALAHGDDSEEKNPVGFAAFTSLTQPRAPEPAPIHPTE